MKKILLFIVTLYSFSLYAQGELLSVTAEIDLTASDIYIEQYIKFNLPDTIQSIDIKALHLEGTELSFSDAVSNNQSLTAKTIDSKGLLHLKLFSNNPIKDVKLSYTLKVKKDEFYLPLFFTNLTAAGSENDFFKLRIISPEEKKYTILFPNVAIEKTIINQNTTINLELPALPSLLRLEQSNNNKSIGILGLVDGFVGLIFLVIGVLIWKNRKRLIYG